MLAVVIALAIAYLLILLGISLAFIRPFRTPVFISPEFMGVPQQPVEFESKGLKLRGWWVDHDQPKCVMICLHGFMMNRAELSPFAPKLHSKGAAFLFFDFPAHGKSQGKTCAFGYEERFCVLDSIALAKDRYPGVPIVLVGSSMGAVAAAFAVAEHGDGVSALILDSAYDKLTDAVSGWWYFIAGRTAQILLKPAIWVAAPLAGVKPTDVVVSDALKLVTCPTLILHGEEDTLAPPKAAQHNYEALSGPKELVWFPGRNHSEARWEDATRYFDQVENFLQKHQLL
jgi:uncharacterized protein